MNAWKRRKHQSLEKQKQENQGKGRWSFKENQGKRRLSFKVTIFGNTQKGFCSGSQVSNGDKSCEDDRNYCRVLRSVLAAILHHLCHQVSHSHRH